MKSKRYTLILTTSVAALVLLTGCVPGLSRRMVATQPPATPAGNEQAVPVTGAEQRVNVEDQTSDGTSVVIADVFSQGPGWIAIHNQQDGKLGPAIGHAPVNDGDNQAVSVPIDPAQVTPVLYAMLHVDAGTVGTYEFPGPDVPAMLNGQMIAPDFQITEGAAAGAVANETPSITVSDQDGKNGKITVAQAISKGNGWLDIHTQGPDGQPADHIGYTAVNDGVNKFVAVAIDPSLITPVMFAMLHTDAGEIGVYELPDPDVAQTINGQKVMVPFSTTPGATMPTMGYVEPTPGAAPVTMDPTQMVMETPATAPSTAGDVPSITVDDQAAHQGMVYIARVVSDGEAWLVIHPQAADGSMGNMIGFAPVPDGVSENVMVPIDTNRATDVLYAMLHANVTKGNAPVFPGADVPVEVDGQMVAPSFRLIRTSPGDVLLNVRVSSSMVPYLVDGDERSLYIFLQDTSGKSSCTGDCLDDWRPLLATGRLQAAPEIPIERLGVILRPDGERQVTYLGSPLYYYNGDSKAGDINGQGVDGLWFLITP